MWISLFFLQGFVICALGYDYCVTKILKCSLRQIWFTEGLLWDSFIENPVMLDIKCRGQKQYMTCIREAAKHCKYLNPILADFIGTREFTAQLCESEDQEFRQSYLKSAACINKQKPLTNLKCSHDMLTERVPDSYPLVDYSCRYLKANLKCRQKVFSKHCGHEAGEIFKRVMLHEFNLDILCNDRIQSKDFHAQIKEVMSDIIHVLLEVIKPIIGLEPDVFENDSFNPKDSLDVLENEQISDDKPFILRNFSPDHDKNQYKANIQTCEKNNYLEEGSRDLPENLDNPALNHDGQELRRFGRFIEPKESFSDLSELEIVTSFKFYNKLLIKLSPLLNEISLELGLQPVRTPTVSPESCDEEKCGASPLRRSSEIFEPEPSETDVEEESDVNEAIHKVKSSKAEANSGFKIFPGVHIDPSTIETIDPFKTPLKPLPSKKVDINYILIGPVYTPFEVHYTDGDTEYAHRTNVKITQKKYYLTPSTPETVLPLSFEDEDV